jgi:hypothetical protein
MTGLPRHRGTALTAGLMLVATALAGCTGDRATFRDPGVPSGSFGLVAFDSCGQALTGLRAATKAALNTFRYYGGALPIPSAATNAEKGAPGAAQGDSAAAVPAPAKAPQEGADYSGTNTHESGVDEPDLVKTDGRRIVTVSAGTLRVVDAGSRRLVGQLDLSENGNDAIRYAPGDMLIAGDHALVLMDQQVAYATKGGPVVDIAPAPGGVAVDPQFGPDVIRGAVLILVDLNSPKVLSRARVDGSLVDARQVGAIARVVVRSTPHLDYPDMPNAAPAERLAADQAYVDAAGIEAWAPRMEVTNTGRTTRSQVPCESISRPASYSGNNLLTVLTFDVTAGVLTDGIPVSIVADGDTVYGTGPSLYVASNQAWRAVPLDDSGKPQPVEPTTEIYKFNTSAPGRPTFVAGGSVPGHLINQYAMSEWNDKLRVATTTAATGGAQTASQSGVYVLTQDGRTLTHVGAVDGLGKGERIYAVRFVGPVGYVVTFRQTDPLYTLDLSDPTRPTVKGELKIPGYSAYLHPADTARLIGVGQDATTQGRVTGTQVSLFDVGDLANPVRLAQYKLAGAYSEAEFEPHAFLYWPADGLIVIPLQARGVVVSNGARLAANTGALVLRLGSSGISEVGFLTHPSQTGSGYAAPIRRSLIINSTLWTVSDGGLMANDKNSLARLAWIPYL